MSKMVIFLPTRGRSDDQMTLAGMPSAWRQRSYVVCPKEEFKRIEKSFPDVRGILDARTNGIAEKRCWILKYAERFGYEKILMLDDDLRFRTRTAITSRMAGYGHTDMNTWEILVKKYPNLKRIDFPTSEDKRLDLMFRKVESMLGVYAHGGINSRYMQRNYGREFRIGGRYMHALGYNVPIMLAHCELKRLELSTDYDYALQLMRAGYDSAVYCWALQEDIKGFQAPGGVSLYRTPAMIEESNKRLAELHPGIVRLVPFRSKQYEGLGMRTVASWKKAIAEGLTKRGVECGTISGKAPR